MHITEEPLSYFCRKNPPDPAFIERYVTGEKYTGIMLQNGRIGVCANLGHAVDLSMIAEGREPDLTSPGDRILVNAWLNALYNYDIEQVGRGDIFQGQLFLKYRNIVMIGSFTSLLEKFRYAGIGVSVFDALTGEDFLLPMDKQPEYLACADCVILSGTTIQNNTFTEVTGHTGDMCDIFLLGPSNILHADMYLYRNIKIVYGSRFEIFDHRVLDIIRADGGTKSFLKEVNKVYISA